MTRQYGAFLLRGWQLGDEGKRFEIAHIQSGESLRATTLEEVIAWVGARLEAEQARDDGSREGGADTADAAPDQGKRAREC